MKHNALTSTTLRHTCHYMIIVRRRVTKENQDTRLRESFRAVDLPVDGQGTGLVRHKLAFICAVWPLRRFS